MTLSAIQVGPTATYCAFSASFRGNGSRIPFRSQYRLAAPQFASEGPCRMQNPYVSQSKISEIPNFWVKLFIVICTSVALWRLCDFMLWSDCIRYFGLSSNRDRLWNPAVLNAAFDASSIPVDTPTSNHSALLPLPFPVFVTTRNVVVNDALL